jgi:hypothetical protein
VIEKPESRRPGGGGDAPRLVAKPSAVRGRATRIVLIAAASVLASALFSPVVARLLGLPINWRFVAMSIVIPLLVAPLVAYRLQDLSLRLLEQQALVRELSGLLPVCAWCHKVRDDAGYWQTLERFVRDHSHASITHGMCPECMERQYPSEPSGG